MAPNSKQRTASFSGRGYPHFIIVVRYAIHKRGLKIPHTFMNKYGRELKNVMLLKDPTGVSWKVELSSYGDGRTMWENKWEDFARHYSIEQFFPILFRYKGNSHFDFFIFNVSATEIKYPVTATPTRRRRVWESTDYQQIPSQSMGEGGRSDLNQPAATFKRKKPAPVMEYTDEEEEDDDDDDVSIEIFDDVPLSSRQRRKVIMTAGNRRSKNNKKTEGCSSSSKQKMKKGDAGPSYKTVRNKSIYKSYKKAQDFTSPYPFFISFMQPSFVFKKFYLEIPQEFVKRYLFNKNKSHDYYTLYASGSSKSWMIRVFFPDGKTPKARIVVGWKEFVEDHGLRVGDVCVFELMSNTKIMNVTIYLY